MSNAATLTRAERFLDRLAELDMALAEKVHAKAMAAEEPEEIIALSRAYQRIARSVRQTLGLQAKLKLDLERSSREERRWFSKGLPDNFRPGAPVGAAPANLAAIQRRAAEVRASVEPAFRAEYEGETLDGLLDELDVYLAEISLDAHFLTEPVEEIVASILDDFDLKAPPAEGAGPPPDPARKSSA